MASTRTPSPTSPPPYSNDGLPDQRRARMGTHRAEPRLAAEHRLPPLRPLRSWPRIRPPAAVSAPAAHLPSSPHAHGNTAERRSLAVSGGGGGGGGGLSGEGIPTAPIHRHAGDGTMHAAMALPGNSQTILTRLFGPRPRRRPLRRRALPGNGRWRHSPHARRGGGEKEGAQGEAHDRKT